MKIQIGPNGELDFNGSGINPDGSFRDGNTGVQIGRPQAPMQQAPAQQAPAQKPPSPEIREKSVINGVLIAHYKDGSSGVIGAPQRNGTYEVTIKKPNNGGKIVNTHYSKNDVFVYSASFGRQEPGGTAVANNNGSITRTFVFPR